jgi:universal stress protein E
MQIDRLLVVFDPTTEAQNALDRAAIIAGNEGSHIHLYACIHSDTAPEGADDEQAAIDAQQAILEKAAAPVVEAGVPVTTEVEWAEDWYQATVAAADRNDAGAVIKSSHPHGKGERRFKRTSDWTLIRDCACPVLLVKAAVTKEARKVLAAIDIGSANENYGALNETILSFCQRYIGKDDAEIYFLNAHKDLASRPDRGTLIRTCGVDSDRVLIKMGDPDKMIVEQAEELGVNLVVIGNSARAGLSALVKSNTAEKVLDKLDCDLLALTS